MAPTAAGGLVDLLPDAVVRVDACGRIIEANAAAAVLTGLPLAGLVGQACDVALDLRGGDGAPVLVNGWPPCTRLRSVRGFPEQQMTMRGAGGAGVAVIVAGTYQRGADGRLSGAVLVLRSAGRRAQQAAAGMEIVATVSHELRSPLASIKGYTGLLLHKWEALDDGDIQMMLEQIQHEAGRVTRLITELLDIGRLETGRLVLRREMIDVPKVVASVVDKVRLEYPDLKAAQDFGAGFPKIYADPDKVEQVLTNLVENACKYASAGPLSIAGAWTAGDVSVTVTDSGEPIPASELAKVFTKFFRRREARPSGSGLGLWISRGLAEAHGGRLEAQSNEPHGTSFRLTLPLIDLEDLHRP